MRRQVTITEVRCDLCGGPITPYEWDKHVGPLDLCWRCRNEGRPCESCGSLPTFPRVEATWAGNCLACWRAAMELPRGKCSALGASLTWMVDGHSWHFCDQLARHPDAHHCPDCGDDWGPL